MIIEYEDKYLEDVRDLLVELEEYIVSIDEPLTSLADLDGKTLAAFGETNIPGITLRCALASENVNPNITYYNAINDGVAFFLKGDYQYLLTSEPVLSNLRKKVSNLKYLSKQSL